MKGETKTARDKLAAQSTHFSVDPRTRHTNHLSKPAVQIEILTPPSLFKEIFDETTWTEMVGYGIKVLKPTFRLNAKCRSTLARATETRKASDAGISSFFLHGVRAGRCGRRLVKSPSIDGAFVNWFVTSYGGRDLFESAGWDEANGILLLRYFETFIYDTRLLFHRLLDSFNVRLFLAGC